MVRSFLNGHRRIHDTRHNSPLKNCFVGESEAKLVRSRSRIAGISEDTSRFGDAELTNFDHSQDHLFKEGYARSKSMHVVFSTDRPELSLGEEAGQRDRSHSLLDCFGIVIWLRKQPGSAAVTTEEQRGVARPRSAGCRRHKMPRLERPTRSDRFSAEQASNQRLLVASRPSLMQAGLPGWRRSVPLLACPAVSWYHRLYEQRASETHSIRPFITCIRRFLTKELQCDLCLVEQSTAGKPAVAPGAVRPVRGTVWHCLLASSAAT